MKLIAGLVFIFCTLVVVGSFLLNIPITEKMWHEVTFFTLVSGVILIIEEVREN